MATPMGYGTLLECPYNKSHRVQATAMARHLFKCRKMHPNVEFVTCPFNHAHKVAEPELKMHTATCDDRANFDMYKYCITTAAATHTSSESQEPELIYNQEDPISTQKVHDDDDECWDDLRIPAYNPNEYCSQAKIIRKATLMTPAEKRVFYENEMKRHRDLDVKIKLEKGEDIEPTGTKERNPRLRSRSRSPVRSRKRSRSPVRSSKRSRSPVRSSKRSRSPVVARQRSPLESRAKRRSRSSSRGSRSIKRRSPSPPVASRLRRSRSNSRKSRSVSPIRDRKRRSVERGRMRRSPSPDYQRAPVRYIYDRLEERDRYSRPAYPPRFDSYVRYPQFDYPQSRPPLRYERDSRRGISRDRDDEEFIYRRDFRD